MDMKQVMQQLLARMDAWGKEINESQEKAETKAEANHKEMMAKIDAETKVILAKTKAMRDMRMETNRESDLEEPKRVMTEMNAKMDAN
jgi:hypothetical protein